MTRRNPLNVMIVDDEPYTREMMQVLVEGLGHVVHMVANSAEALDRLLVRGEAMDVMVIDVLMPGYDGLAVVRTLRANAATRQLPIVCVSAKANGRIKAEGLRAGCDRYLTKPIHEDRIFEAITEALVSRGRLAHGETFH